MRKKLQPPNEREHIRVTDPMGQDFKIYKGIPTIIPSGSYVIHDTITEGYYICGENDKITWTPKGKRWNIVSGLS